jgi:hypothetical protein
MIPAADTVAVMSKGPLSLGPAAIHHGPTPRAAGYANAWSSKQPGHSQTVGSVDQKRRLSLLLKCKPQQAEACRLLPWLPQTPTRLLDLG